MLVELVGGASLLLRKRGEEIERDLTSRADVGVRQGRWEYKLEK